MPNLRRISLVGASFALLLTLTGCCCGGGGGDAKLPDTVPTYPEATNVSGREILGVTLFTFNAQAKGDDVQDFYDDKLDKSWEPVESKWRSRRKLAGTSFEYRRFKAKEGKAYLMIDLANNGAKPTFTEIHYCPDGPARCKPK